MSGLSATARRWLQALVGRLKAVGRRVARALARRLFDVYAEELKQFADLAREMRALREQVEARLDKQEGFEWDHIALARRLARLEDHVEQLLRRQEMNRTECIPFRASVRCTHGSAPPKEAA